LQLSPRVAQTLLVSQALSLAVQQQQTEPPVLALGQ
jgi:hypothetical protein